MSTHSTAIFSIHLPTLLLTRLRTIGWLGLTRSSGREWKHEGPRGPIHLATEGGIGQLALVTLPV